MELQKQIRENLFYLFADTVQYYVDLYEDKNYFPILTTELWTILQEKKLMYADTLTELKLRFLGKRIFMAYNGEAYDLLGLKELVDSKDFVANIDAMEIYYSDGINFVACVRRRDIAEFDPILHEDIQELVVIRSMLEALEN